jgi:hypothetical protein
MAIPEAPTITQTVPTTGDPIAAGTPVADLFSAEAETYAIDGTSEQFEVVDATLQALTELDGAFSVSVTASNAEGTSSPTTQTLTFAENENPWDDTDDHYPGNPQLPPPLPSDNKQAAWQMFLVPATHAIVRGARNGVDFVVARPAKNAAPVNTYWNDAYLGPRPTAEIEAEARRLAAEWPDGVTPIFQP